MRHTSQGKPATFTSIGKPRKDRSISQNINAGHSDKEAIFLIFNSMCVVERRR
jgi:hypothetical protein